MPATKAKGERWVPVPGYEFRYEVSSLGRIRHVFTSPGTSNGRILRGGRGSRGDRVVSLWRDGERRGFKLKDLVALAFLGPRPEGKTARCLDGNPENLSAANVKYRPAHQGKRRR